MLGTSDGPGNSGRARALLKIIGLSAAMHDAMKGEHIARKRKRPNVRDQKRCKNPRRVVLSEFIHIGMKTDKAK
jgi:hypothetical protein